MAPKAAFDAGVIKGAIEPTVGRDGLHNDCFDLPGHRDFGLDEAGGNTSIPVPAFPLPYRCLLVRNSFLIRNTPQLVTVRISSLRDSRVRPIPGRVGH